MILEDLTPDQNHEIGEVLAALRNRYGIMSMHWIEPHEVIVGRVHADGQYTTDLLKGEPDAT
jgi:hypothetical protein